MLYLAGTTLLAAQLTPAQESDRRPRANQLFERLDKDSDGQITADEIPDERREMFGRTAIGFRKNHIETDCGGAVCAGSGVGSARSSTAKSKSGKK